MLILKDSINLTGVLSNPLDLPSPSDRNFTISDEILNKINSKISENIEKYFGLLISNEVMTVLTFILCIIILLKRILNNYVNNLL